MFTIGLQPTESLVVAVQKMLAYHFHDFLKQEMNVRLDNGIEALHDMRVATRRMRATIRIFEHGFSSHTLKFLKRDLKKTAQVLGLVRDLDVFIEKLTHYQCELSGSEREEIMPLLEYCQLQRGVARTKLLAHFDGENYAKFKQKMVIFVKKEGRDCQPIMKSQPIPYQIRHIAPSLIYSYYEAVRAYEPFLEDVSTAILHWLRIDFKHLRYTLENFQEILGNESVSVIAEVKQMQTYLGDLNDTNVACHFLADFLCHWKDYRHKIAPPHTKKPIAVINYLEVKITEREQLLAIFPEVWQQFNSTQLRCNLALAML
jgi:CHAD domain-containing protein